MAVLLFVDPNVPAYGTLLNGLSPTVDVVLLHRHEAGIDQMTRRLLHDDGSVFEALHILCHGADGTLALGGSRIDEQALLDHAEDLASIGARIADDGQIVLYGCEVAKTAHGRTFVERLAQLTGAHVAATSTPTGADRLGGDWSLQYRTGGPDPVIPFDDARRASYPHVLVSPNPFDLESLEGGNGFAISGADGGDEAGFAVAAAGDVNGDGLDDFILGARNAHIGIETHGAAYVVFGTTGGYPGTLALANLDGSNGFRLIGAVPGDQLGFSVDSAGDINGDGFDDVIVGAPTADPSGHNSGAAYIVFGRSSGFAASLAAHELDGSNGFRLSAEAQEDWAGAAVSRAGDVNGDGFDDFIIGARFSGGGFLITVESPGAAYVVFGKDSGFPADASLASLNGTNGYKLTSVDGGDFVGFSVADAGDVNGDGFDDIIVGARDDDANNAAAYIVFGQATGFEPVLHVSELDGRNGFRLTSHAFTQFGVSVAGAGDVNDDGFDDMIVGASTAGSAGTAFVVFGKRDGWSVETNLDALHGANGFRLSGIASDDRTGFAVSHAGDVNGDGFGDVLIGAPSADPTGGYSGQAYVVFGKAFSFAPDIDLASLDGNTGFRIPGQSAGDQAGFSVGAAGDLNNDGIDDLLIGAPGDDGNSVRAGSAYVLFGSDASTRDLSRLDGSTGFKLTGSSPGDQAGFAVSVLGDINGDGFDDVAIGAFGADVGSTDTGTAYVVFGRASSFVATSALSDLDGTNGFRLTGLAASDLTGRSVAAAGDLNGDGFGDFIVGAPRTDAGGADAGAAYVVFGRDSGFPATFDPGTLDGTAGFALIGSEAGDMTGEAVASAGDINGDGYDDFIIGAPYADTSGIDAGAVYVVFGRPSPFASDIGVSTLDGSNGFRMIGFSAGDYGGRAVAGAGDVNGDGLDDILVGAWGTDVAGSNDGACYVVFGRRTGFAADLDLATLDGVTGLKLVGAAADRAGFSVGSAGDINGDGYADFIIGASAGDGGGTNSGTAHVVFGKASGFAASVVLASLDGTDGFRLDGVSEGDNTGRAVAAAGDVDGDGYDDLLVGASNADAAGNAYLVYGKAGGFSATIALAALDGTNGFKLSGSVNDDDTGRSVSGNGDVNGDGFADIVIGANLADPNGSASGAAYVIFGGNFTGAVTRLGTSEADVLPGTLEAQTIAGRQGNDLLIGHGGADVLLGGAGNDRIEVPDLIFRRIDGGSGVDTLALTGRDITLDLTALGMHRIEAIEQIDLTGAGNNALALLAGDVLRLSSTSNQLRVLGDAGDVVVTRGWTHVADVSGGPDIFRVYTQDAATLLVDTDVVVANAVLPLGALTGAQGTRFVGVGAGDGAGTSVRAAGDVNRDGFADFIVGAPQADPNGGGSGAGYIMFGKALAFGRDFALSLLDGDNGLRLAGPSADDTAGYDVAAAGDINGDGYADVILGAPGSDVAAANAGAAYVVFGKPGSFAGDVDLGTLDGIDGFLLSGPTADDHAGIAVDAAGDVNGDGIADILVGAPGTQSAAGAAYVVYGRTGGFAATLDLGALDGTNGFKLVGAMTGDRAGTAVAHAGDVNGDGFDDVLIGARTGDGTLADSGVAYLVFGRSAGTPATVDLNILDGVTTVRLSGLAAGDETGFALGAAGDVNGDGFDDVIVGAFGADNGGLDAGTSFVVFGKGIPFASDLNLSTLDGTNGFRLTATASMASGISARGAGDVNGDGYDDLLVGAANADAAAGAAYVVYGKGSGFAASVALDSLDGRTGFKLAGDMAGDAAGRSVSAAGDVNGDGFEDLIVGAPGADDNAAEVGATYLVYGGNFTGAITQAGTSGSNVISGTFDGDAIVGGAGDDTINGRDGPDTLHGNAGDDSIDGGNDSDRLYGGGGNDTLIGDPGNDRIYGGSGNDTLIGHNDDDRLEGEAGNDILYGGFGDDVILGGTGSDQAWGEVGADLLLGGTGDDVLFGEAGADRLYGEDGDDTLFGGVDDDVVVGDAGDDRLYGDAGADALFGADGADRLLGEDGDDRLYGGNDDDNLFGQSGADLLLGGAGSDSLFGGAGSDDLFGGIGADLVLGEADADRLFGGDGNDLLFGQDGNDQLQGEADHDRLFGGAGNDLLFGQEGDDELQGEADADRVFGGAGNDLLFGQEGDDELQGGGDNDRLFGGDGNDLLFGQAGDDELQGEADDDRLFGGNGNDYLFGQNGSDELHGDDGDDRLFGDEGDDLLVGWAGNDLLYGGSGADRFVVTPGGGADVLADFEDGIDTLNLRAFPNATLVNTTIVGQGSDTLVSFIGGETVLIVGIDAANITGADIQFA